MTSFGETSAVRFIPCGVISNAHEIKMAKTKPSARNTTKTFINQPGASKVGKKIVHSGFRPTAADLPINWQDVDLCPRAGANPANKTTASPKLSDVTVRHQRSET